MQNEKNYFDIFDAIITSDDRNTLLNDFEILLGRGSSGEDLTLEDFEFISLQTSKLLKERAKEGKVKRGIIQEIVNEIDDMAKLVLIFGFSPSERFLKEIKKFLNSEFSKPIYIDININKDIIGGLQIEYDGKYADFSLQKLLDEGFEKNKESILKLIHS